MEADYTNDIVVLANSPAQAKTLLQSLEWTAASIDLHDNADKTEYMCFNQRGATSKLNRSFLKSSPTEEADMNTWLAKAWTPIGYRSHGSQTWPIK